MKNDEKQNKQEIKKNEAKETLQRLLAVLPASRTSRLVCPCSPRSA
jgi:lipid A disaccharide synthetase